MFLQEQQEESRKEDIGARETMKGEFWSIFEAEDQRSRLSILKSELVCDFHYNNK
jgi:hypothetical protein